MYLQNFIWYCIHDRYKYFRFPLINIFDFLNNLNFFAHEIFMFIQYME
jgi:hypothetical protein